MKVFVLRVQQVSDYNRCLDIRKKVFQEEQQWARRDEIDQHEDDAVHFLAYVGHDPAGTARFRITNSLIKFERVATLPNFRGLGVGSQVITQMLNIANEDYPHHLPAMHAQTHAIDFYKKLGWVPIGSRFLELGNEVIMMIHPPAGSQKKQNLKCLDDPCTPQEINKYFADCKH